MSASPETPTRTSQSVHKLVTKSLVTPTTCADCDRFIWGFNQLAVSCQDCGKSWHKDCESFNNNDCDMSLVRVQPQLGPSKKKPEVQYHLGHVFHLYSYPSFHWCNHCNDFIWGLTKQGWKCSRCDFDCHTHCVPLVATECNPLKGGQLKMVKADETKIDPKSTLKVRERRTKTKVKQTHFKKEAKFRLKTNNSFVAGFVRHSLLVASPQVVTGEDGESGGGQAPDTPTKADSEDELESPQHDSSSGKPAPLSKDPDLIEALSKEESFSKMFQSGVNIREKREDPSNEQPQQDFVEQSFSDFFIDQDRVLGSGQFGVVKYAVHKKTNTPLAVKVIDKKKFWGKKNSQRHLKREIAIMSSIKHPNIIRLYAVFDNPTELYLFMELVEGGDLLAYVEKKGALKEDEGKFLFHQLCTGVKYLHDAGVIHRDLKPENLLLLEEDGVKRLKLADFGFANIVGDKSFVQSVVGTPAYVAPEILKKNTKGYQKSADIWSIGVIMYACLSGVFPFDEDEPVEDQIKAGKFTFPDEYWEDISDEAIDLICNLLVVDPKERATIDDVLNHPWFSIQGQLRL